MKSKIAPTSSAKQILVRGLHREDLLKMEFTGYSLGKKQLLTATEIQTEINRRARFAPQWFFR